MFKSIVLMMPKPKLTLTEWVIKLFTRKHPVEMHSSRNLPMLVYDQICKVVRIAERDGIDTSNIRLWFRETPNIGIAHLSSDDITIDTRYLDPAKINDMAYTLLHELRHFDQYRKGYMIVFSREKTYWMGGTYKDYEGDDHYLTPWEVDANAYAASKFAPDLLLKSAFYLRMKKTLNQHNIELKMLYKD